MRRLLFLIAAFLCLIALPVHAQTTTTPSPTAVGNYVTARDIYVRGGPGEFFVPVGRLVEGAELEPLNISADGRWVMIRYSRGFGWIRRDLAVWADDIDNLPLLDQSELTPTSLATDTPVPRPTGVQVAAGEAGAYVRFGPGVNFPYLGAVVSGEFVDPVGRNLDGDWILIRFRDGFGWVSQALLARNVPLGELPILLPGALTPSATPLASLTPTASNTPTRTQTPSQTPTVTLIPTNTPLASGTVSATDTPTQTPTETISPTATLTATLAPSEMPTFVPTNTLTASITPVPSFTATPEPSATPTETNTLTRTATETSTLTATFAPTETLTFTATNTSKPTDTSTNTASPEPSATETETATTEVSALQVATRRPSATITRTMLPTPSDTATSIPTATGTASPSLTATETETATNTPLPTTSVPTQAAALEATDELTETPTRTHTQRSTNTAAPTVSAIPETATRTPSAEATEAIILPAGSETLLPSSTLMAQETAKVTTSLTVAASATGMVTATRTPAGAIILPTPVSSLPEADAPSTPTVPPEAFVGGLLLLALILYVGLYWRGLSVADRYSDGFVIQRCPVCQQGHLSVETRLNRILGIPRPRSTVRCDTCRSVLREAGRRRWRYAVDPSENPPIYKRFNGKILDETRLIALENSMPPALPPIHSPTKPPVFLDDEE